jgi:pimeloyl-ACP methyl ester carboxylesterase
MSSPDAAPHSHEGTVAVAGGALFYKEAGTGPPLLLIHGSAPDSRAWSPVFEDLARDHRVIAYDRRGYGRSACAPLGGGWRRHGEDAAELLPALKAAPATVIGWSGGGLVALHLACEHPQLVRSLVLIETGLPRPPAATASFLRMLIAIKLRRRVRGEDAAIEALMRWLLPEQNGTTTWDRPEYPKERREEVFANSRGIWADFALRGRADLSQKRLARVRCPVTCVVGSIGQPWFRHSAEVMLRSFAHGELVVVRGMNHAVTYHVPARLSEALRTSIRHAVE